MPNDHRITIICSAKTNANFPALSKHLNSLIVPPGYIVDQQLISGDSSTTQGYNLGLRNSEAKYKIYLNQHVTIANCNLIRDALCLFQNYPQLGLLGVIGAKRLPANGNWREAPARYGTIAYLGKSLNFHEVTNDYEPVQAVDGLFMITQFDLIWSENLFSDYFYDAAYCLEFQKAGYQVGIPKQPKPWCAYHHPGDTIFQFYQERDKFIDEYQQLIPKLLPQ